MINIGRNIKTARKSKGYSQIELGEKIGVSDKTISSWENNRNEPSIVDIQKLADALGTRKSVLIDGLDIVSEPEPYHTSVKVYGKIAAGEPIEMVEDVDEINCPWATKPEKLFALQVKGDSMNKVILDGHYAILEKCEEPITGKIYAVIVDNENATLKRLHILDGGVILEPLSTNPEHERKTYEGEEVNIRVIGRYIGCVSPYQN